MKPIAVAKRYARAFADAVGAKGAARLEPIAAELSLTAQVIGRDGDLLRFFDDPSVPRPDKSHILDTLQKKGKCGDLTRRLLDLLVDRRRLSILSEIAVAFEALRDERLGIVAAETTTARPLGVTEQKRLREALETMTGRTVKLKISVDPAILGGARTRIGSKVYDGTLKRRLALLRDRLAAAR